MAAQRPGPYGPSLCGVELLNAAARLDIVTMQARVWLHWVGILGVVATGAAFSRAIDPSPGTNLALLARVTVSSNDGTLASARGAADGDIWNVGFRTELEPYPWVILDLGAEKPVSRIVIYNCYDRYPYPAIRPEIELSLDAADARRRFDCRQEDGIPLLVELSCDGNSFAEAARQVERFELWDVKLSPKRARFVRVRLLREGHLQLREIEVY